MPQAAKSFQLRPKPKGRVLGKQNYGPAWAKFRAWYASVHPAVCVGVLPSGKVCGAAYESRRMHLDHHPPLKGKDDPGLLDEKRVRWMCVSCHSKKTVREQGGKIE